MCPEPRWQAPLRLCPQKKPEEWFFLVFFGTAFCCLALAVISLVRWQRPGTGYLIVGSLLYLIGTILVTIACNVPLNDALAGVDQSSAEAGRVWANYPQRWTAWNHVRTGTALAAASLFTVALCRASPPCDVARSKMSSPTTSAALLDKPEDWPRQFEEQLNAGNLDGMLALYEPGAHFVNKSGETLVARDAIRKVLGGMIEVKTQFRSRVVRATIVGEIAQLYTDFEGTRLDGSGKKVPFATARSRFCDASPTAAGS